jgi:hypothetical protein
MIEIIVSRRPARDRYPDSHWRSWIRLGYLLSYQSTDGATGNTGADRAVEGEDRRQNSPRLTGELYERVNKQINRASRSGWAIFRSRVAFPIVSRVKWSGRPSAPGPRVIGRQGMRSARGTPSRSVFGDG